MTGRAGAPASRRPAPVRGRRDFSGGQAVEQLGHRGVGLEEGVDRDLEGDPGDLLQQVGAAPEGRRLQAAADLGPASVDGVDEADELRMGRAQPLDKPVCAGQLSGDRDQTQEELRAVLGRARQQMPGEALAPPGIPARQTFLAQPRFHRRPGLLQPGSRRWHSEIGRTVSQRPGRPEADDRARPELVPMEKSARLRYRHGSAMPVDGEQLEVAQTRPGARATPGPAGSCTRVAPRSRGPARRSRRRCRRMGSDEGSDLATE